MTHIATDKTHLTTKAYASNELLDIRIRTHELYTEPKSDRDFAEIALDLSPGLPWEAFLDQVRRQIEARIATSGEFRVSKTSGVFIAAKGNL